MSSKESIYGLLGPKKVNPNLIVIMAALVILAIILVYSGRHSKITFNKVWTIETNIPSSVADSSVR
jgi:hypothetical protein